MGFKQLSAAMTIGIMAVVAMPSFAGAATNVVTDKDVTRQVENTPPTDNWVIYSRADGSAKFRTGPGTTPLGVGSLELTTLTGADKITAYNYDYRTTPLKAIDAMSYSTYRTTGTASQVAALNVEVDINGDKPGGFTTLVFEPIYNTNQGTVVSNQWQAWDAYKGGNAVWWSSNPIEGAPNRDTFVSWNTILAANPDAVIVGGYGINQGSGNSDLVTAVDKFTIGKSGTTTTYDFDVPKPVKATNKEDCKNEGYKSFQTPYKNQGDCVSAVASNDKAKGNPKQNESPVTSFLRAIGL